MKSKKFHGFTLTPEVVEEFKNYAKSKGSNVSYEIERLMRSELAKKQKSPKESDETKGEENRMLNLFIDEMLEKYTKFLEENGRQ